MKPPAALGHSMVSPCLMVESIQDELQFLKAVFGAEVSQERGEDERSIWQLKIRLGDSILMLGRANRGSAPPAGTLYVWTEDVEGTYTRAMQAGATLISAPTEQTPGVREAGFKDPQGHIWWVAEPVRKLSSGEVERRLTEQRRKRL